MKTLTAERRSLLVANQVHRRAQQSYGLGALSGSKGLGATEKNFVVPSGLNAGTASQSLLDAVNALLTAYNARGVPSEHSASPEALSVQNAWNADPLVLAAGTAGGSTAFLDTDSGYGPNTHDAVAAVNGGSAPDVNTAAPGTTPAPTTVVVNKAAAAPSDWTMPLLVGAAIVAAAGVGTAAILHVQKRRKARRTSNSYRPTMPHGHRPAYT